MFIIGASTIKILRCEHLGNLTFGSTKLGRSYNPDNGLVSLVSRCAELRYLTITHAEFKDDIRDHFANII
ncbi:hypothetical protein D9M71_588090 [compost metagenome]